MLLLDLLLRSTFILLAAGLLTFLLRHRRSAAERHLVWLLALASLLLLPLLRNWTPLSLFHWQAPEPLIRSARTVIHVTAQDPLAPQPTSRGPAVTLTSLWILGVAVLLARHAYSHFQLSRLIARSGPGPEPDTRLSSEIQIPLVGGLFRPVILLPQSASTWSAAELSSVLAHERMHIVRRDNAWQALAQLASALYWPQPLVWLAHRALHQECERACDDGVLVSGTTSATSYADVLVHIARALAVHRRAAPAGGIAMTRSSQLTARVHALLDPAAPRNPAGRRFSTAALTGAALLVLAAAGFDTPLLAQQGRFSGVVRDASGAAIPRARLDLRTPGADGLREVVYSNDSGEFSLDQIPDGVYDLTVAKEGFALLTQQNLVFESGKTRPFELTLQVGRIRERVQVTATGEPASLPRSTTPPTRIRVGGNVQAAKLIYKSPPAYPVTAKQDRVQGTVVLRAVIGLDGSVTNLEPLNRAVDQRLVDASLAAVRLWRYSPTLLNGNPIEVVTEVEVNFTLAP